MSNRDSNSQNPASDRADVYVCHCGHPRANPYRQPVLDDTENVRFVGCGSCGDVVIEPALSWNCAFCVNVRIYEGGKPDFGHLRSCEKCGSRLATTADERSSITRLIDLHLL